MVKGKNNWFQAVRYEEEGEKLVVQGPITTPRKVEGEEMLTIAVDDAFPAFGIPFVCRGLKDELAHLNGKIGDARSYNKESDCYMVHFEDETLEPCLVQRKHIKILFELPDVDCH